MAYVRKATGTAANDAGQLLPHCPHVFTKSAPTAFLFQENSDFEIDAAVASHFLHSGFAAHQQAYAGIYADNSRFDNAAVAILVGDALLPLAHHSGTE